MTHVFISGLFMFYFTFYQNGISMENMQKIGQNEFE